MKRAMTLFFQGTVMGIGSGTLLLLLWLPHLEGRNINATPFEIYFKDPFLAYVYLVSILFFVGLYQVYKVLGYVREAKVLSNETLSALRTVRYCALTLIACITVPIVYLFTIQPGDDIAGGVAMGIFIMFASSVVATTALVIEKSLQSKVKPGL